MRWLKSMRVVTLAVVLVAALLLSACSGGGAAPSGSSGGGSGSSADGDKTFRIAVGIDPDTLDPAGMTTTTVANMVDYIVETLVKIDKDGNIQPALAESWQVAPDGRSITFKLRQGVKFQDGTPFNAEAVKFNIERILNPDVRMPLRASYAVIQGVEVQDEYTVTLQLKEPAPYLLGALTYTAAGMISPNSVNEHGNSMTAYQHPVGTGPYVLKQYTKGSQLVLEKFQDYWGEKPYYDQVVFQIVPEAATRESLLLAGQVDMIILPPTSDIPALQKNSKVKVLLAPSDRTIFVAINTQHPALKDKRVRQALNYAVNKEEIIENVLFGAADVMDAPMAKPLLGYCQTGPYPYDPEKAKQLLQEAGVTNLELKFVTPTGRYLQDYQAAQAIANFLQQAGVKTTLSTMDWPTYTATVQVPPEQATVQLHILGWAPTFMDAQQQMLQFTKDNHPPKGLASSYYTNPRVEELVAQANREVDQAKREQLYCEAAKIIWEDAPWIFLWVQRFPIVHSAEVTNISYLPNEKFDAIYARPVQ
ncbi:ABC transporter substrate-binding protein [Thermaerobacter subterraneus]|uniref:ABC-type dipeptide transport system, periplasmic component n=1 Tax=Thermaerobacter subterraneus DSM 13965 TaxID=867903 RepID=K6QEM6_9FIRM|nr:ABC transporter substrate-binding protein [Thermaerobacter subterraneus]EKP95326.1 ABC-type dipeptide transport system, periplasmic component [Thermaerobacter subterraneus DSM 13965]